MESVARLWYICIFWYFTADIEATAVMQGEKVQKGGKSYFNVVDIFIDFVIGHASVYLSNLFDGDRELGNYSSTLIGRVWLEPINIHAQTENDNANKPVGLRSWRGERSVAHLEWKFEILERFQCKLINISSTVRVLFIQSVSHRRTKIIVVSFLIILVYHSLALSSYVFWQQTCPSSLFFFTSFLRFLRSESSPFPIFYLTFFVNHYILTLSMWLFYYFLGRWRSILLLFTVLLTTHFNY